MTQREQLQETLAAFVARELLNDPHSELGGEDDLFETGLVDSLGVMRLINHIEEEFTVSVPVEDVTIENFVNLNSIAAYLDRRLNE